MAASIGKVSVGVEIDPLSLAEAKAALAEITRAANEAAAATQAFADAIRNIQTRGIDARELARLVKIGTKQLDR